MSGTSKPTPPPTFLVWCPVCGRTDRWKPLKDRHFADGGLCKGKPKWVRYEPVRQSLARRTSNE